MGVCCFLQVHCFGLRRKERETMFVFVVLCLFLGWSLGLRQTIFGITRLVLRVKREAMIPRSQVMSIES